MTSLQYKKWTIWGNIKNKVFLFDELINERYESLIFNLFIPHVKKNHYSHNVFYPIGIMLYFFCLFLSIFNH